MTFNKCSIAGVCYGDVVDEATGETIELTEVCTQIFHHNAIKLKDNFSNFNLPKSCVAHWHRFKSHFNACRSHFTLQSFGHTNNPIGHHAARDMIYFAWSLNLFPFEYKEYFEEKNYTEMFCIVCPRFWVVLWIVWNCLLCSFYQLVHG